MDHFQAAKKPNAGSGVVNLIVNGVLAYYFYTYWKNNPDEGSCWAASDGSTETGFAAKSAVADRDVS